MQDLPETLCGDIESLRTKLILDILKQEHKKCMRSRLVHKHQNGLRFYRRYIPEGLLIKYEKLLNFHEPFQEMVFNEILRSREVEWYLNIGAGWGYYALLARKIRKDIAIHAVEPNGNRCNAIREHMELNELYRIHLHQCFVGEKGAGESPPKLLTELVPEEFGNDSGFLSFDIQGAADKAIAESSSLFRKVKHVLVGTHDDEHQRCEILLKNLGYEIVLSFPMKTVPLQPDGILWARKI